MPKFCDHLDHDIKNILLSQVRDLWTHTSTAIEGNSLTLGETQFILAEGLTIHGKSLKDHNEIFGHAKAINLIYAFLTHDQLEKLDLFKLHQAILTERVIDIDSPVGDFKNQSNYTTYIDAEGKTQWREYPLPKSTAKLMSDWLNSLNQYLNKSLEQDEALKAYADLHITFVTIHPFFDGNGRLARLLSNLPVLKSGWPPVVVPTQERFAYKNALADYQNTIDNLREIRDLEQLPSNSEKEKFITLCANYWQSTIELLDQANAIQARRLLDFMPK